MNNYIAGNIQQIIESKEWEEVDKQWAIEREMIINKGKRAREDVKKTECWAELAGFDRAIMTLKRIAAYRESEHIVTEQEEN